MVTGAESSERGAPRFLCVFDAPVSTGRAPRAVSRTCLTARIGAGELGRAADAALLDGAGNVIDGVQAEARTHWPDGSVEWIGLTCPSALLSGDRVGLARASDLPALRGRSGELSCWAVDGGTMSWRPGPSSEGLLLRPSIVLLDGRGGGVPLTLERRPDSDDGESASAWRWRAALPSGRAPAGDGVDDLSIDVSAVAGGEDGRLDLEVGIHNPHRAVHADGFWDLGDPASIRFAGLRLLLDIEGVSGVSALAPVEATAFEPARSIAVRQRSSGRAPTASGGGSAGTDDESGATESGYEVRIDGALAVRGSRADPALLLTTAAGPGIAVRPAAFWQEFPAAIEAFDGGLRWDVFPAEEGARPIAHELQPGERKRKRVVLAPVTDAATALVPAIRTRVVVPRDPERRRFLTHSQDKPSPFDESLRTLMVEPQEFFAKRERIDEYGWRDYGEVFADHESLYQEPGAPPFVSHYNNQYDLVRGFLVRFMTTGDLSWLELADDLVRHVIDIDIYHTEYDRCEYNHGLFWHTNHYTDAATSTHRTYSRANRDPKDPASHGGGPGAEHCYTGGLTLHYALTGQARSREAVMGLACWMIALHEGDPSLSAGLQALAGNELRRGLPKLRGKSPPWYRYPMTRGTGNFVEALLDAHLLGGDPDYLERAESVLLDTFGPGDDVGARGLDDAERCWSYTVLLQAALRYLEEKESRGAIDGAYRHVQHAFRVHARWMVRYEAPYLERPQRLAFVNDTWAAQDIRRVVLFRAAALYDPARATAYREAAERFAAHVVERLHDSAQTKFSRLQALILLHAGVDTHFRNKRLSGAALECAESRTAATAPSTARRLARSAASRFARRRLLPSPAREWAWIRDRLGRPPAAMGRERQR